MLHQLLGLLTKLLPTRHTFYCLVWVYQIWSRTAQLHVNITLVREPTKSPLEEQFLAFNGGGVGDSAAEGRTAIVFNGTADMAEEDGGSMLGLMLEEGTRDTPGDKLVQDTDANDGDEIHMEGVDFTIASSTGTADITDLTLTGGDAEVYIGLLEDGASDDQGEDKIILNGTDGSSSNANEGIVAEDYTSDIVVYTQAGSSTGTASVLNGVTVAAS